MKRDDDYMYETEQNGRAPAMRFDPFADIFAEPPIGGAPDTNPEPVELTALMARTYPKDRGVVGDGLLIRRGFAVVGGAPKLGKSGLVLNLALRRACGLPWLGFTT